MISTFEAKKREEYLRYIGVHYIKRTILICPMHIWRKMHVIYLWIYKNGINFMQVIELFFSMGILCFFELVESHKVTSMVHMLRLHKAIMASLQAYVEITQEEEPFTRLSLMRFLFGEMERRKLSPELQIEFINYMIDEHKAVLGERIVVDRDDVNVLFMKWLETKRRTRTLEEIK